VCVEGPSLLAVFNVLATCSLQFAKAGSAAMSSQQEKGNSEYVQRGCFIYTEAS
jgi:hypothetical protein